MSADAPAKLQIAAESTPNPHCMRFALNRPLLTGAGQDFASAQVAAVSPLATELFTLPGVTGIYIGPDFVSVTAEPGVNWWALRPLVSEALEHHVASGLPAVSSGPEQTRAPLSPLETAIVKVIEDEIQPAVAMDGGLVLYAGYEEGIVKLRLRGACHSCPRALFTLKMGIEHRLKQQFPEVQSVEAV
ncbi:MAG TPA: NifU family protein [Planctomycetota bacterium]